MDWKHIGPTYRKFNLSGVFLLNLVTKCQGKVPQSVISFNIRLLMQTGNILVPLSENSTYPEFVWLNLVIKCQGKIPQSVISFNIRLLMRTGNILVPLSENSTYLEFVWLNLVTKCQGKVP